MNSLSKITSIDQLPKRFQPLAEKIGLKNALVAIEELAPRPAPKFHWVEEITEPEHFPQGIFQDMANLIGVENTLTLMHEFEGENIYIRKIKDYFLPFWHTKLRNKWRKHNIKELAHEFDVSEPTVRQIANDHEDQISLFES